MTDKLLISNRIAIFGWPATGKSTLAELLKEKLNLPLFSLDNLRWKGLNNGKKDDEAFLAEYNKILTKNKWIIEGNALDWIDSSLNLSDTLIFFDSSPEQSVKNYLDRQQKVKSGKEKRVGLNLDLNIDNTTEWIKTRYANKIVNLRPKLQQYKDKLIVIQNFDELEKIEKFINSKTSLKDNISKLHTTPLGVSRIKANLGLAQNDVVEYIKQKVLNKNCNIIRRGKNWYCTIDGIVVTINAHSYTIITAHKM